MSPYGSTHTESGLEDGVQAAPSGPPQGRGPHGMVTDGHFDALSFYTCSISYKYINFVIKNTNRIKM